MLAFWWYWYLPSCSPSIPTALISINKHIQYQSCYFHGENNQYTLAFPRGVIFPTLSNPHQCQQKSYRMIDKNKHKYLPTPTSRHQHSEIVYFRKVHPKAQLPHQGTSGSIGFDVHLPTPITLQPNKITKIPSGLASSFP